MGRIYEAYVKRALDVALSGCALVALSPVMGVTALLVRQKLGSPVIFCQERPGKDEQIFKLYKFRTMTDARGADGNLLPDAQRLTPFGRRLRSRSCGTSCAAICRSSDRARCWSNTCRIIRRPSAAAMPCAPV